MLFLHCVRRAASRACCTAGRSSAIRIAMIAITTSNSINVKPKRFRNLAGMTGLHQLGNGKRNGNGASRKIEQPACAARRARSDAGSSLEKIEPRPELRKHSADGGLVT